MENPYKTPDAKLSNLKPRDISYLLFSFEGRIDRSEFWIGLGAVGVTSFLLVVALKLSSFGWPWSTLVTGVMLYPLLAVTAKRYHDQGKSGWLSLIWLAPLVGWMFAVIECGFSKGGLMHNQYGPPLHGPLVELKRNR